MELLVPELQTRGLMWTVYAVPGGTFLENMHRKPEKPLLPDAHAAATCRYEALKKNGNVDADGHVVIDRLKEEE